MKCRKSTKHTIVFIAALFAIITATSYSLPTEVKERKIDVKLSELPTEISKVVRDAFPNSRIIRIEKEIEGEDPGQYDFLIRTEGIEYEVEISSEGKIIQVKEVSSTEDAPTTGQGTKWTKSFDQEN